MNWCHFINFWGQVLNWCQLIKFWGLVLNWCQLINIWGHILLIILEVDCGLCPLLMFSCFSAAAAAGVVPLHCTSPDNNRPFQALFPLSDIIFNPCPQFIKQAQKLVQVDALDLSLQCFVILCNTLQYSAILCNTL